MADESPRNIILVCMDSVRKDYFDSTATRVPQMADVSFNQCRAASSWSAPSYASMISGLLPHQHDVNTHSKYFDSLTVEETIFDTLDEYRTVGISANVYAGRNYGFDVYFDDFVEVASHIPFPMGTNPQSYLHSQDTGTIGSYLAFIAHSFREPSTLKSLANGLAGVTRAVTSTFSLPRLVDEGAKGALRAAKNELRKENEPTFMFISLMEGHLPHKPALHLDSSYYDCPITWSSEQRDVWDLCLSEGYDEQYWTQRNQLYRASIDYLDRIIDKLRTIVDRQTNRETSIIVTADHGENHGTKVDEGLANHKSSLSEGLLHVPLYLINPPHGYRSDEEQFFSHLAMPDLIEAMAYGETPDVFSEKIPAEIVGMSPGPDPDSDVNLEYWDRMIRCGYNDSMKVVWDSLGRVSEFRLDESHPAWQQEQSSLEHVPIWARGLFDTPLGEYKEEALRNNRSLRIDDDTKERLEELGYL